MLHISQLSYRYGDKPVLSVERFTLARGQHALLLGPSGCGKSTLLHLLAAILRPQQGLLTVAGIDVGGLTARAADAWRGRTIGLLPQQLALVASLSARDNVLLAAYANGKRADAARADELLDDLGLAAQRHAYPHQLSQGQRQRVAMARALYLRPALILADEPTANLDDDSCAAVLALLAGQAQQAGASLVIASHDARVASALPQTHVLRLGATSMREAA